MGKTRDRQRKERDKIRDDALFAKRKDKGIETPRSLTPKSSRDSKMRAFADPPYSVEREMTGGASSSKGPDDRQMTPPDVPIISSEESSSSESAEQVHKRRKPKQDDQKLAKRAPPPPIDTQPHEERKSTQSQS